jgi:hypothetical protein
LVIAQWWDKCVGQDTFMFRKLDVCKTKPTSNIITLNRVEPKLVAMYDMLGRPIDAPRDNEIVIYLYSDGTIRKMVRVKN